MAVNGTWLVESSTGLIDFLKACGASGEPLERAKNLEKTGAEGVREVINVAGDALTIKMVKPDGTVISEKTLKDGVQTDDKSLDGRDIKVTLKKVGPGQVTREEVGNGYTATWARSVDGNKMKLVMKTGGTICTRTYTKQ